MRDEILLISQSIAKNDVHVFGELLLLGDRLLRQKFSWIQNFLTGGIEMQGT